ncbi:HNH endonuclease family protein [Nocardioides faecalis]|uniref:HNH endonuclease family protein n=1 Tax=Nocardioides faecalis TaxID=2803858 RepID=UPI0020BF673C|nr:HNH endonuclease family protein [Nocardioides faecalis]
MPDPLHPGRPHARSLKAALAALATGAVLLAGACAPFVTEAPTPERVAEGAGSPGSPGAGQEPGAVASGTALAQLETLTVKGRAPKTGYDRDHFGPSWTDDVDVTYGHNGCDTRNDILRRDLVGIVLKPGTRDCVVAAGVLPDPYTGRAIRFLRGQRTSAAVQIDHVVSLSDAWQTGAQRWGAATRTAFAGDPLNLLAADGRSNAAKSDSDTATWLPPYKAFRCEYVARQVAVKARYGLWVKPAEKDAMARVLSGCPTQPAPTAADATRPTRTAVRIDTQGIAAPTPSPTPRPALTTSRPAAGPPGRP